MTGETILYKLRFIAIGMLITAGLAVLSIMLSTGVNAFESVQAGEASWSTSDSDILTTSLNSTTDEVAATLRSTGQTISKGSQATARTSARHTKAAAVGMARGGVTAFTAANNVILSVDRALLGGAVTVARTPVQAVVAVGNAPVVRAAIRPADRIKVPVINPRATALAADMDAAQAAEINKPASPPPADTAPAWPIHGAITTRFGVPHWPYQPTHTGLDISDGQRSGVTAVHPFKPGRIAEVIHSYQGLGNHIVIDHGDGLSSLYGHLASTSVQVGQMVGKDAVLGFEGNTGASTGTHLHFEVRLNGEPQNPFAYVPGTP
jgi:murein DD-endopeptidase MepM/ murein hydrolase activator NlpD